MTTSVICIQGDTCHVTSSIKGDKCSFSDSLAGDEEELSSVSMTSESTPVQQLRLKDLLGNGKCVHARFGGTRFLMIFEDPERVPSFERRGIAGGLRNSSRRLVLVQWHSHVGERELRLKLRSRPGRALRVFFLEAARGDQGEKMARFIREEFEDHGGKVKAVDPGCISLTFSSSDPDFPRKMRDPATLDRIKEDFVRMFFPGPQQEDLLSDMTLEVAEPPQRRLSASESEDSGSFARDEEDSGNSRDSSEDSSDEDSDEDGAIQPGTRKDVLGNGRIVQIGLVNTVILANFSNEALEYMDGVETIDHDVLRELVEIHWKSEENGEGFVRLKLYVREKQDTFVRRVLQVLVENRAEHLADFVQREHADLQAQLTAVSTGCVTLHFSSSTPGFRQRMQQHAEKVKADFLELLQLQWTPEDVVVEVLKNVEGEVLKDMPEATSVGREAPGKTAHAAPHTECRGPAGMAGSTMEGRRRGFGRMKQPSLLEDLQAVLDQYPDNGQILKELIQNADDAGASVVRMVYDGREFPAHRPDLDINLDKPWLLSMQGPALCVYNDAEFEKQDWDGIKRLRSSVKAKDKLKVGRFGLGFKSIFHMTDHVAILSGDQIMFINPLNVEKEIYELPLDDLRAEEEGLLLGALEGLGGLLGGLPELLRQRRPFPGTVFWLPLRQRASPLSNTLYSGPRLGRLLQAFRQEADVTTLFLRSLLSLEIHTREATVPGLPAELSRGMHKIFHVHVSDLRHDRIKRERSEFKKKVEALPNENLPEQPICMFADTEIEVCDRFKGETLTSRKWLVGWLYSSSKVTPGFAQLCRDPDLAYSPWVGLAAPLQHDPQFKGHTFCFLPLPLLPENETGLPVHVNASFALGQDRQQLKRRSGDQAGENEGALSWNQGLKTEVLAPLYLQLIRALVERGDVSAVYGAIPNMEKVADEWKPLADTLVRGLEDFPWLRSDNSGGQWLRPSQVVVAQLASGLSPDVQEQVLEVLVQVYLQLGQGVVRPPAHVTRVLPKATPSTQPSHVTTVLRQHGLPSPCPSRTRLLILEYLLTCGQPGLLAGLQLLPTADGGFQAFQSGQGEVLASDQLEEMTSLLPGLERHLLVSGLRPQLRGSLLKLAASGTFQLKKLNESNFPQVLQRCLGLMYTETVNLEWVDKVWSRIYEWFPYSMNVLRGMKILPEMTSRDKCRLHDLGDPVMCEKGQGERLPANVASALRILGLKILSSVPESLPQRAFSEFLRLPTPNGAAEALGRLPVALHQQAARTFNQRATAEERKGLAVFMKAATSLHQWPNARTLLRKLQIFKDTSGAYASLDDVMLLYPVEGLPPVKLPSRLIQLHPDTDDLAKKLGASHKSSRAVIEELLGVLQNQNQMSYSVAESEKILVFLLTHLRNDSNIMVKAGEARLFQLAGDQRRLRAKDVFDPQDSSLKRLFENENKLPVNQLAMDYYLHSQLLQLGMKGPSQVTSGDIQSTAHKVEQMHRSNDREAAVRKAEALVEFVHGHESNFQWTGYPNIRDVLCWPVQVTRPLGYSRSLNFLGETTGQRLAKLTDAVQKRHWSVAGSSALVTNVDISDTVARGLSWSGEPSPAVVVQHLRNLVGSYDPGEAAVFAVLRSDVYDHLSKNLYTLESNLVAKLSGFRSVWTDDNCGFRAPGSVWVTRHSSDVKLEPYRFALSEPMKKWRSLFKSLGAAESQDARMLTAVLKEIRDKHEGGRLPRDDLDRDLRLCLDVLESLRRRDDLNDVRDELLVPVHSALSDRLVLKPVSMCTVCDQDWLKDLTDAEEGNDDDEEEMYYVHERVGRQTAEELGVPLLTDRVLTDTRDLDTDFGLKEELTTLLHNLLREYKDGFSVPKELVQNADDAGASCVRFLYDQRENRDARTCLIDAAMADTQGEALWVFNDALFSEADLASIQKYNGATKESDAATIGKFGLGFCSVYNLTDVPQFVSGKTIVFFDPRQKYLRGKKGLRVDIGAQKNQAMLRRFRNQLKPFDGVFGCSVSGLARGKGYDGTLFRFPLRQPQQAANNEIKDLHYSESEMKEFLRRLVEGLGNLLLFTQSVTSVEVHHLPRGARGTQDARLLYKAEKHNSVRHLLRTVSRNLQTEVKEHDLATVKVMATEEGNAFLGLRGECSESVWRISWCSHGMPTGTRVRGAVSLAAVAAPLSSSDEAAAGVVPLDKSPFGFYREGHVFVFLPLPEETALPVHLNGAFAVTSSREHLVTLSGENTSNAEGSWNKHLLQTSVTDAYLRLLTALERCRSLDTADYYGLWPREGTSPTERILVQSFYAAVTRGGDARVFRQGDRWAALDGARFLDPEIRGSSVDEIALEALQEFWPHSDVIVDLPDHVIKNLQSPPLESAFQARWVRKVELFREVVLPNIGSPWWTEERRGRILLYALEGRDAGVLDLLRTTACVATRSRGLLRSPPELVHPEGAVASLFLEDEERFPAAFTQEKGVHLTFLDRLTEIGMAKDELPWEQVVERAETVSTLALQDPEAALKRSRAILHYLTEKVKVKSETVLRYTTYPEHCREELSRIEWLPVLKRPTDWPCHWAADRRNDLFAAPSELYNLPCKDLTGCLFLVHDQDRPERTEHAGALVWLGVKSKQEVILQNVVAQLNAVESKVNSNEAGVTSAESVQLVNICREIYTFLKQYLTSPKEAGDAESREKEVKELLCGKNVVYHAGKFIPPEKVCFASKYDLEPYLYVLEHEWKQQFKDMFAAIGVSENHVVSEVDKAMESIRASSSDGTVRGEALDKYCRMAALLADLVGPSHGEERDQRYLPDTEGHLELVSDLCWADWDSLVHMTSLKHVHAKISQDVAQKLGVKSNRAQHAQSFAAPFACAFGQKEELTDRIRNILKGYPRDSTVMKEFLQNADDAGATELVFLKDFRSHGCETVLCETWKPLQGPALCVYNNSSFSASDIAGIQRLGLGSKEDDPLKTGQYGVGFNAIYHLTDAPAFWTKGENLTEEGDSEVLCVLDPNMFFVPPTSPMKPGIMLRNLDQVRQSFPDVFSGFLPRYTDGPGTFFRFPLRNKEFAERSKIPESRQEITTQMVEKLLEEMKTDMFESLMFLSNVRKISIARVEENGDVTIEYAVESTMSEADGQAHRDFMAGLTTEAQRVLKRDEVRAEGTREVGLEQMETKEVSVTLTMSDAPNGLPEKCRRREEWLVVHRYGFQHRADLPETLRKAWADGVIKLLPRGGVAVLRNPTSDHNGPRPAFCILPLPVPTGLPVAVNGHFALSSQDRRNLWHGNDHRDEWNREIVRGVIVPAYLSALTSQRDAFPEEALDGGPADPSAQAALQAYHGLFPSLQSADGELWKFLVQDFFQRIVAEKRQLFPVVKTPLKKTGKRDENENRDRPSYELKWKAVAADSGFPGIFQNLAEEYFHLKQDAKEEDSERLMIASNTLVSIMMALGLDVVASPMSIYRDIQACLQKLSEGEEEESAKAAKTVHTATPPLVINFLKTFKHPDTQCLLKELPRPVDQTVLGNKENLRRLVDFCAKDEEFISKLPGLPLCLSQAKEVREFSPENPVIASKFADLLPKSANLFLHDQILRHFEGHIGMSTTLKRFDVQTFGKYLEHSLPRERFGSGRPCEWTPDGPSASWICRVWKFFSTLMSEEDKERKQEEEAGLKKEKTAANLSAPKPEDVDGKDKNPEGATPVVVMQQLLALENWCLLPAWIASPTGQGETGKGGDVASQGGQTGNKAPAQDGKDTNIERFLYPIRLRHHVFFVQGACALPQLKDILEKVGVPKLSMTFVEFFGSAGWHITHTVSDLASKLVARVDNSESMLTLLTSDHPGMTQGLKVEEGRVILKYFCDCLKDLRQKMDEETLRTRMRELPFFFTAEKRYTAVSKCSRPICIEDCHGEYVPKLQLRQCLEHHAMVSLFHFRDVTELYKLVSIERFEPTKFYTQCLLNFFAQMPDDARLVHLDFVRDYLLAKAFGKDFSPEQRELIDKLKTVPFVRHGDGSLKTAGEFFSPNETVFQVMRPNRLLPEPFCAVQWIEFAELVGMVSRVDEELFVQFANEVAQNDADGRSEEASDQSRCLLDQLWSDVELLKGVSRQIGSIRFAVPHVVREEMTQICPQHQAGRLVAFQESVASDHCHLVWSVQTILSEEALPGRNQKQAMEILGVPQEPDPHSVLQHAKAMCGSLKTMLVDAQPRDPKFYAVVRKCMESLYQFLRQTGRHIAGSLESLPVIYLDDTKMLVSCESVVLNIDDDDLIEGLLFRAPTVFGAHFDVFQAMGVSKRVTPDHFAKVLEKIYQRTAGRVLPDNDFSTVAQTVRRLFHHLSITSVSTQESEEDRRLDPSRTLYLPNLEKKLVPSSELVFADNEHVRKRAGNLELNYFLGFEPLDFRVPDPVALMRLLPEGLRPQVLSDLLFEELTRESRDNATEGYLATQYKDFLSSPEFILGVIRLLISDGREQKREVTEDDARRIETVLSSVRLKEVKNLQTQLRYQDRVLSDSKSLRPCFEDKSETTIYLNDVEASDDARNVLLSQAVSRILPRPVGNPVFLLLFSKVEHPGEIVRLLDELSFPPSNYKCARPSIAHPDAGSFVPETRHWTLENGFCRLRPGECVGREVYDGLVSGDADSSVSYDYVIVKRCVKFTGDLHFQATYVVKVEEEREEEVAASALYKLTTNASSSEPPEPTDLSGVRRYLKAGWASPDLEERRRVVKRLYLQWHPDTKPPPRRDLCQKAATAIRRYVHRLSRGGAIASDDDDDDDRDEDERERPEAEDDWESFFRVLDQRVEKHRESKETCEDLAPVPHGPNPQPQEARRYLRQAERDVAMAERALKASIDSNWVCFLGQQAAEKAIKAALYKQDAGLASYEHDLPSLSGPVGNSEVSSWASQLQGVIGHFNALRYPDNSKGNRIPAEVYDENDASRSNALARKIVDKMAEDLQG